MYWFFCSFFVNVLDGVMLSFIFILEFFENFNIVFGKLILIFNGMYFSIFFLL